MNSEKQENTIPANDDTVGCYFLAACSAAVLLFAAAIITFWIRSTADAEDTNPQQDTPAPHHITRSTPNAPEADGYKTFIDKKGGYRLQYPTNWKMHDHSKSSKMIRADLGRGKDAGAQIRLLKTGNNDFPKWLEHYLAKFKSDMESHWGGKLEEISRKTDASSTPPTCRIAISFKRKDGQHWFFKQYIWFRKGKALAFQSGAKYGSHLAFENELDAIADSVRFDDTK